MTKIMGILNVTPDSFSDGGKLVSAQDVHTAIERMVADGVDIIDIGGESTRPGAQTIPVEDELARVKPAIDEVAAHYPDVKFSIDTRKAAVAAYALEKGAFLFNDVSALTYDPDSIRVARDAQCNICLMHAQGTPETMQASPDYDNVVHDVYTWLEQRIAFVVAQGIDRTNILVDPGIGFGKTTAHNLALMQNITMFHDLGAPILLGTSRKRFIGEILHEPQAHKRQIGSLATHLYALSQDVQILRVHDVKETRQAVQVWKSCQAGRMINHK